MTGKPPTPPPTVPPAPLPNHAQRKGVWRSLTHDWAAKLLALMAACVLWFFASEDRRAIIQQSFDVPVTVRDNTGEAAGEKRAVSGLSPSTVKVTLSGRPQRLSELRGQQIEAVTDITNLAEGSFNTVVTVTAPEDTKVIQVMPERVQGLIDTVQTRTLPVTVTTFAGESTQLSSTQIPSYKATPAEVTISGPSRSVNEVAQVIYAPITLATGQSQAVHLLALDSDGQPVPDITLRPPVITLTRVDVAVVEVPTKATASAAAAE